MKTLRNWILSLPKDARVWVNMGDIWRAHDWLNYLIDHPEEKLNNEVIQVDSEEWFTDYGDWLIHYTEQVEEDERDYRAMEDYYRYSHWNSSYCD